MLVHTCGASGTRVFPSTFPPPRSQREARGRGGVPHPSPPRGWPLLWGREVLAEGPFPERGWFPCALCCLPDTLGLP